MKPVAIGRKNRMFAGSDGGGNAMAVAFVLIENAQPNSIDPPEWLTCVPGCIADHKIVSTNSCHGVTLSGAGQAIDCGSI